ncbi:agmatinase [Phascolomyces articulosus]|uniref:Agmatinase n=1 Tax=Phascolomyces articulosus TaxID=60185 RepID=A0AAD5PHY1_9FUNG|nr:agmatinase [Phascolomyces articulosus]
MNLSTALFIVATAITASGVSVRARTSQVSFTPKVKPISYPTAAEGVFSGIGTFAHFPYVDCFRNESINYDTAILAPFDTATIYRPGTCFNPSGICEGSRRTILAGGYNVPQKVNPFTSLAVVLDTGDIAMTPYDNEVAIRQLQLGHQDLLHRTPADISRSSFPRVITLGGDHTITLPILRALNSAYGPASVIHFDSHSDTWYDTTSVGGASREIAGINHGTYFYGASKEGLIKKGNSFHAGIRTTLNGPEDYEVDEEIGFEIVEAREIDGIGTKGVIEHIRNCVGDNLVYLSIDIDTLDPSFAPTTGTPESDGWSTRELRRGVSGLAGLNLIGADIVEVSPPFDDNGQITAIAAADLVYEVLSLMVRFPVLLEEVE